MSMTCYTILQMVGVFFAYSVSVLFLPSLILGDKLKKETLSLRFLAYFTIGNVYIILMGYALTFLGIDYGWLMGFLTIGLAIILAFPIRNISLRNILDAWGLRIRRRAGGQLGKRTGRLRLGQGLRKLLARFGSYLYGLVRDTLPELVLGLGIFAGVIWIYGSQTIQHFGYGLSDLLVHNYWINSMEDGELFVAGIYPFGFHQIIYYLHRVYGFDTYVILRVFGVVMAVYLYFILLAFLRSVCRNRFTPYLGAVAFLLYAGFDFDTYYRYSEALPQEFGLLFVLPGLAFFYRFMATDREKVGRVHWLYLTLFGLGTAGTLLCHFYDSLVMAFYFVGLAVGFLPVLFRQMRWAKILATGFLALFVSFAPLILAYAGGTGLQGSFGWGLNIIYEDDSEAEEEDSSESSGFQMEVSTESVTNTQTEEVEASGFQFGDASERNAVTSRQSETEDSETEENETEEAEEDSITVYEGMTQTLEDYLYAEGRSLGLAPILILIGLLLAGGIVLLLLKETKQGAVAIGTALATGFLVLLIGADSLHLISLMNEERTAIYLAMLLCIGLAVALDLIWNLVFLLVDRVTKGKGFGRLYEYGSYPLTVLVAALLLVPGIREPIELDTLETNEAITCLTNIIAEETDYTWTIVSANDERTLSYGHGNHYELWYLLYAMEDVGSDGVVEIGTDSVFFFVEKKPLDYYGTYEGSGSYVSEEGASMELPETTGSDMYWTENRYIYMSRAYYWAAEYQKLHPYEMTVYYEDEDFICYRLDQNTYRCLNLAIDYGYNTQEEGE